MGRTLSVAQGAAGRNARRGERQEIVKPSEMISARPVAGRTLSLPAMKCYNLMLGVAQANNFADERYSISKKELRRSHKGNERLSTLLDELHSVVFMISGTLNGKPGLWRMSLLAPSFEEDGDEDTGNVHFRFPPELLSIIQHSEQWAILLSKAVIKFESLYALRLYEIGCLYINRQVPLLWLTPDELRRTMQVPKGAYSDWANLRRRVIDKAVAEINKLADFTVSVPEDKIRRRGRAVTKFMLLFAPKPDTASAVPAPVAADA